MEEDRREHSENERAGNGLEQYEGRDVMSLVIRLVRTEENLRDCHIEKYIYIYIIEVMVGVGKVLMLAGEEKCDTCKKKKTLHQNTTPTWKRILLLSPFALSSIIKKINTSILGKSHVYILKVDKCNTKILSKYPVIFYDRYSYIALPPIL